MVDVNIDDLSRYLAENVDLKNKIIEVVSDYLRDLEATSGQAVENVTMTGFDAEEVQPISPSPQGPAVPVIPQVDDDDDGYSSDDQQSGEVVGTSLSVGRVTRPGGSQQKASAVSPSTEMTISEFQTKFQSKKVADIKSFMRKEGVMPSGATKKPDYLKRIYENPSARANFIAQMS